MRNASLVIIEIVRRVFAVKLPFFLLCFDSLLMLNHCSA
jgi:hypothetical protein